MPRKNEIDMLHGPLLAKIIIFAMPLAASSILQQLFNSVDVAVVGRFDSSYALAAVGSNGPVISLLINLFLGISMGANVVISNHIGQKDNNLTKYAIRTTAATALFSGLALAVIGVLAARPILTIMGTPTEVLDMAVRYLRIYFIGTPFLLIYNFGSAILRSKGDTSRPLYILVIAGIINTVLNLILVIVFHMGVAGVAIATDIANVFSAASIIFLLIREEEPYRLNLRSIGINKNELKSMLMIGVPAGLQGMVFSFSNVLLQTTINSHGADAVAGSAAAVNFEYYCYFIISAFNGAAITFIAQNYGAGNYNRVKRIYWLCLGLSTLLSVASAQLFIWQKTFFVSLFTTDASVAEYAYTRMLIVLLWQFIACSYEISASAMRGMGKSMLPTLLTIVGTCLLRVVWVFAVCPVWTSYQTIMIVYPITWITTGIMVFTAFHITARKKLAGA
jgi:putative MATE family efflux protein|uniref:MATE family efflux transporter n=1 Tax=Prevotella sp. TaxID=59823 RepID=UPI0026590C50